MLEKTDEGFVYVKVSDEYIPKLIQKSASRQLSIPSPDLLLSQLGYMYEILNRLGDEEAVAPPYFGEGKVGAHITLMEASEGKKLNIPQLGSMIAFEIVDFAQVEVVKKKEPGAYIYVHRRCARIKKNPHRERFISKKPRIRLSHHNQRSIII